MSGAYDPGEIQRRIGVCFSATELRQFIEALGLASVVGLDKSTQEMGRQLVRHFERQGTLDALVTRLKQARPLMEWPEPTALPAFSIDAGAPAPAPPPLPASAGAPAEPTGASRAAAVTETAAGSRSAAWPPPSADTRILADPYVSPDPPIAPGWPGTVASPPRAQATAAAHRANLKIWLIVAASAIAVAIAAFAIGRASSPSEPTAGDKAQSPAAPASAAAVKTEGPAAIARTAIDSSLANVARACEIPIEGAPDVTIFQRMTERCGSRPPALPRPGRPAPAVTATALPDPLPPGEPSQPGERSQSPSPPAPQPPAAPIPAPGGGAKAPPAAPNAGCLSACEVKHRACRQGCGAEPKQSTQYAPYQACLGKCLEGNSKCRLGCK